VSFGNDASGEANSAAADAAASAGADTGGSDDIGGGQTDPADASIGVSLNNSVSLGAEGFLGGPEQLPVASPVTTSFVTLASRAIEGKIQPDDAVLSGFLSFVSMLNPFAGLLGFAVDAARARGLREEMAGPPPESTVGTNNPGHSFVPPAADTRRWPVPVPGAPPLGFDFLPMGSPWAVPAVKAPDPEPEALPELSVADLAPAGDVPLWPVLAAVAGLALVVAADG
jgi:hypothetical protein